MATTQQKEARTTTADATRGQAPQHEHHWLEKLVGDWRVEGKMTTPTGEETTRGEETVRSLDGLWFIAEGEGEMPGGNRGTTILTLGYDTIQGKYVGTFIGSMMTYQWVYEGELEPASTVATAIADAVEGDTFETYSPDMRGIVEWKTGDPGAFLASVAEMARRQAAP